MDKNANKRIPSMPTSVSDFARMQSGEPYKIYKKTILGKKNVKAIDPFTLLPTDILLTGREGERTTFIELWNERELVYFQRANKKAIEEGILVEHVGKIEEPIVQSYNNLTDPEMEELINSKFFTLRKAVLEMTTEAPLYRLIELGEKFEKPEKTMAFLREQLSMVQSGELEE